MLCVDCRYNAISGEWAQDQVHLKMGTQVRRVVALPTAFTFA